MFFVLSTFKNTMDERTMAIKSSTNGFVATNSYYTTLEYDECVTISFIEFANMPSRVRSIWKYEKVVGYMNNQLFGSFLKCFDNVQG
jgi:hypothetical protein